MDAPLRNRLWNLVTFNYWKTAGHNYVPENRDIDILTGRLWHSYFKKPYDTRPKWWNELLAELREYFFSCPWYAVYDFLEFVVSNYDNKYQVDPDKFMNACNYVLETELSAYRFVGREIVPFTSEEEIAAIEKALNEATSPSPIRHHLQRSLELLSDREKPDYRNSIKEAISAVEALCRIILGNEKAELGQALREIEAKGTVPLHAALKSAFVKIYSYTSDADGIRHALMEEAELSLEDAQFMLVACSAFVNYLLSKANKAGISLSVA